MTRFAGFLFVVLFAVLFLLPAPGPAAEPTTDQTALPAIDPDIDEGHRLFAREKYEEALEHYLKALKRNKEDAYLHFRIGLTYYMLDDVDNSHVYWLKSYDFDPDLPDRFGSQINSESMQPALLNGDRIITDDQYYKYNKYNYGDIVDYSLPFEANITLAKRIVGLPGDIIEVCGERIYRNGVFVKGYDDLLKVKKQEICNNQEVVRTIIPNASIFMIGDVLRLSSDSREHGPVEIQNIFGRVLVIFESYAVKNEETIAREERFGLTVH